MALSLLFFVKFVYYPARLFSHDKACYELPATAQIMNESLMRFKQIPPLSQYSPLVIGTIKECLPLVLLSSSPPTSPFSSPPSSSSGSFSSVLSPAPLSPNPVAKGSQQSAYGLLKVVVDTKGLLSMPLLTSQDGEQRRISRY